MRAGGNFIDTADVYSTGVSEQIVGRWLKTRPTEARQMVVATKGRFPWAFGPNDLGLSRRHLGDALDARSSGARVERIDLTRCTPGADADRRDTALSRRRRARRQDRPLRASPIIRLAHHRPCRSRGFSGVTAPGDAAAGITISSCATSSTRSFNPARPMPAWACCPGRRSAAAGSPARVQARRHPTGATCLGENRRAAWRPMARAIRDNRTWRIIETVDAGRQQNRACRWPRSRSPGSRRGQLAVTSVILGARTVSQLEENLKADAIRLTADDGKLTLASAPASATIPGPGGVGQRNRKIEGGR